MQTRRDFLSTLTKTTAAALATHALPIKTFANERPPNILFISVDDLNDWIGCLGGHPDTLTPNIDRLASHSTLFTRAYCNAPACNPSRASLMTGLRPSSTGVYGNRNPFRWAKPNAITMGQHFQEHGYHVFGRGKIFHGRYPDPPTWHTYIGKGGDPMPQNRPINGIPKTGHFDWSPLDISDEEMDDTKVAHWTAQQLQQTHNKPFFLACGLFRPHLPWYAPQKYFDKFSPNQITLPNINENDLDDIPQRGQKMARQRDHNNVLKTDNWQKAVAAYLACINFTDTNVGHVLNALQNGPNAHNTIVVFWGDHGWHLGEKLHWRKFALWEEATRVPLLISTPGQTGAICNRTVSLIDLYPTLSDLCNLPIRPELEGYSLRPLLNDANTPWNRPVLTTHGHQNHSIRSERYRYIRYRDGSEELYDHNHDPLEWTNLANDTKYAHVMTEHQNWLPQINAPESKRDPN